MLLFQVRFFSLQLEPFRHKLSDVKTRIKLADNTDCVKPLLLYTDKIWIAVNQQ